MWATSRNTIIRLIRIGITNCYLVDKKDVKILIDTGQKSKSEKLKSSLYRLLGDRNLDYVILTHAHYDHAENALMLKKLYSPKILVHKNEADFLENGFMKLPKGTNVTANFISASGNRFASWIGKYNAVTPDIKVTENYKLENTEGIEIVHTPGHTSGSISIIVDNEIALVGDTLFGIFPKRVLPPFADDKIELYKSWNKLLETSCKIFLPAHGKTIKREILEKKIK